MPTTTLSSREPSVFAAIMRMEIKVRNKSVVHMDIRRMTTRALWSLRLTHEPEMTKTPGQARDFQEAVSPWLICVSVMLEGRLDWMSSVGFADPRRTIVAEQAVSR